MKALLPPHTSPWFIGSGLLISSDNSDLDRARALLADDPDEMGEQWLAGIIATIRTETAAAMVAAYAAVRVARWRRDREGHPTPCLSALASGDACQPDETLKRCAICGFVVAEAIADERERIAQRGRLAFMFDHFAAEAIAAERERIARRVSEHQILRFQVGRDPLVEVNEFIQDLAHDIATDWEDYE